MSTPRANGYRQPAEWSPHRATWLAWPSDEGLWGDDLEQVRQSFIGLCRALADELLEVLVGDADAEQLARDGLSGLPVHFTRIPFGDIWLRDTGPIFVAGPAGVAAVRFRFNGWGEKYILEHDDRVAERIAARSGLPSFSFERVLEGGSVDSDGEGTVLTTRQCLLNPNRSGGASAETMEALLNEALGADKVLWLGDGLLNDHTDGHVDTVARFVRPGVVVTMRPSAGDPNRAVLETLARDLAGMRDAKGRRLEVVTIPSPGLVSDKDGRPMPASYVNFYIGNRAVVVPTYGAPHDAEAVERIGALFPGRRTVGVEAKAILVGGGAFHCITQQEPSPEGS